MTGNPFSLEDDDEDCVEAVLDRLLMFPHDERLLSLARDSASQLFSELEQQERHEKLTITVRFYSQF